MDASFPTPVSKESLPIGIKMPMPNDDLTPRERLDNMHATIAALPLAALQHDARGRLRFANAAALRLFDVPDFTTLVGLIGPTLTERVMRLRPRRASTRAISRAIEDSMTTFTPERMQDAGPPPRWGSLRRRDHAEPMSAEDLPAARALRRRVVVDQLISVIHPAQEAEMLVRVSAAPIVDANGRVIGALEMLADVTEEMLTNGSRDAVLAISSQEIRTPLTPVLGTLQIMLKHLEAEGDRFAAEMRLVETALSEMERLRQIADDLEAIVVMDRDEAVDLIANVDLVTLCKEIAEKQMQRRPDVPIRVLALTAPMLGVWSRSYLEHALAMLIASAANRSPAGKTVTVRLKEQRRQYKVEIIDHGPPLSPERLEDLEQVLDRGGAALALTHGWDLDLSTVQTMLALNRSRLWIASRARVGTIMWFMLPMPLPQADVPFDLD
jgi:signal transduction histidine kinase